MPDKFARARHKRSDTASDNFDSAKITRARHAKAPLDGTLEPEKDLETKPSISSSAGIISVCVMISRITGFARTWAMAFALGATFLSSSYQVANNLPNMLFELVMGGMLVTAFLPVYVSVKKKLGKQASQDYASNILTLIVILLGIVSLLSVLFPQVVIYTQTFYSDQKDMSTAIFLFQFFAIQTVFYGASSVVSGLLNANRDYLWSSIAPTANNVIVIITFIVYAFVAPLNPELALYIIAIGNPLGVVAQLVIQLPALKRRGIRLRPRINLRDPALRETLRIGVPALFVMVCAFVTVSVMNAASYSFADNGPSIIVYARLWYTLPYSFLAVPITTAMFTELSDMQAEGNRQGVINGIANGTGQILFMLIPFMFYLIVFSFPLVTLYHIGAFNMQSVEQIAGFLAALALALPFYGVSSYLQKAFSSLRKMGVYAGISFLASIAQVILTMGAVYASEHGSPIPIESIAWASAIFYLIVVVVSFIYLRWSLGRIGLISIIRSTIMGTIFGALGALAGWVVLYGLELSIAPLNGSVLQAFIYVVIAGLVSLFITFGLAIKLRIPEASLIISLVDKLKRRRKRA